MIPVTSKKESSSFAPILIGVVLALAAAVAVFAFVPLVECRRCNEEGQFSTEVTYQGRRAVYIDYCDCGTFFKIADTGKREKIPLLRSLMRPRSLKTP